MGGSNSEGGIGRVPWQAPLRGPAAGGLLLAIVAVPAQPVVAFPQLVVVGLRWWRSYPVCWPLPAASLLWAAAPATRAVVIIVVGVVVVVGVTVGSSGSSGSSSGVGEATWWEVVGGKERMTWQTSAGRTLPQNHVTLHMSCFVNAASLETALWCSGQYSYVYYISGTRVQFLLGAFILLYYNKK